jgi:drug/metabolite transporter (DMT)-like permease
MSPVVATAAGIVVLRQTLSTTQLLGAAFVLAAIWIGQRPTPDSRPTTNHTTTEESPS